MSAVDRLLEAGKITLHTIQDPPRHSAGDVCLRALAKGDCGLGHLYELKPLTADEGILLEWILSFTTAPAAESELKLSVGRTVEAHEFVDLVFGTGALGHPWWLSCNLETATDDGEYGLVDEEFYRDADRWEETEPGDRLVITHWDGETEGGRVTTTVTFPQLLEVIQKLADQEHLHPDTVGELGMADALEGDNILQLAVFGAAVYG